MVYERFIVVNGEKYGPYYYESYRDKNGKVVSRRLKDYKPEKKDVVEIHKKSRKKIKRIRKVKRLFMNFMLFGFIFGMIFLLVFSGGGVKIIGFVVSELADEKVVQSFDKQVDLEVKESVMLAGKKVSKNKNKRMDFDLPDGKEIRLYFDLLNYSEFVEEVAAFEEDLSLEDVEEIDLEDVKDKSEDLEDEELEEIVDEVVIEANDFDIVVAPEGVPPHTVPGIPPGTRTSDEARTSEGKDEVVDSNDGEVEKEYKWGYKVRLDDLNFMAKIDVTAENISVYDEYSLKVGNNLLSFKDLVDAGYSVRIESPSLENDVGNLSDLLKDKVDEMEEGLIEEAIVETGYGQSGYGILSNFILAITGYIVEGINQNVSEIENVDYGETLSIFIERDFSNEGLLSGDNKTYKIGDVIYLDPFLIILISDAEHLDVNREFVSDIYDEVREKDNNWSEVIGEGEYVRVRFEENLTNENDVTVYARMVGNVSGDIEIYREGGDEIVAEFENISSEGWYKVYLDGSSGIGLNDGESEDVFDLKIVGGNVEFDYIVDPSANDSSNDVYQCGTLDSPGNYQMNQSITNNSLNDNCINITSENVTLDCAGFYISSINNVTGIYSNQFNTTIRNCNVSTLGYGIELVMGVNNSYIFNNTFNNVLSGIIAGGFNNTYEKNNVINSSAIGIHIISDNNNFTDILINKSSLGLFLNIANFNNFNNLTILNVSGSGLDFAINSDYNNISNSIFRDNARGIELFINSDYNYFNNIELINNSIGLYVLGGINIIYDNEFNNISSINDTIAIQVGNLRSGIFSNMSIQEASIAILLDTSWDGGDDNLFRDISLINNTIDVNFSEGNLKNNTFLNVSYNISKEYVFSGSELIRKWYYQAYVNDSDGNDVSGANVSAWNVSDNLEFSILTNLSGWTNVSEITEYVNVGGTKNYYSNYTINATNVSDRGETIFNVSLDLNKFDDVITIDSHKNLDYFYPSDFDGDVLSRNYININVSGNSSLFDNVSVSVFDFEGNLVEVNSSSSFPFYFNFSGLSSGFYYFNSTLYKLGSAVNSTSTRKVLIADGLNSSTGYVLSNVKIASGENGFYPDGFEEDDAFGISLENIGDLDNDGVQDLAVGAAFDENSTGSGEGAVYILLMYINGSVKDNVKIASGENGFYPLGLNEWDYFGSSISNIGDLDNDGVQDLAVGATQDENSTSNDGAGAVYILFMHTNGSVKDNVKIALGESGFYPMGLDSIDYFGSSISNIGDLDNDGVQDLAVGAYNDENSTGNGEGAVYILFMHINGSVKDNVKIASGENGFDPNGLDAGDGFGFRVSNMGDLDNDGVQDLAVGAAFDENSTGSGEGAVYILLMYINGSVKDNVKIALGENGFNPNGLDAGDAFGTGIANIGDLDNDGIQDLAVGAYNDENSTGNGEGAVYILFMHINGSVKNNTKIALGENGFNPNGLDAGDRFSVSLTNFGDLDGDGIVDLAVGSQADENSTSITNEGALYILNLGNYVAPVVPVVPPAGGGDDEGGGGGGSTPSVEKDFSVSKTSIDTDAIQGESKVVSVTITNTESSSQSFNLNLKGVVAGFISLSESSFSLGAGETKDVNLSFETNFNSPVGIYSGELVVVGADKEKIVNLGFEINKKIANFEIDLSNIEKELLQGDFSIEYILIENDDDILQYFNLSLNAELQEFVSLSESSFVLDVNDVKNFSLNFNAGVDSLPGVYTGSLTIGNGDIEKEIFIVFTIEEFEELIEEEKGEEESEEEVEERKDVRLSPEEKVLFDVILSIDEKFRKVFPGDKIILNVSLINLGDSGKTRIPVTYEIKDFNDNVLISDSDSVSVETELSFSKIIKIPILFRDGSYVVSVEIEFGDSIASSSKIFEVEKEEYVLLEFEYDDGNITLLNRTLEKGKSSGLKHDSRKEYKARLVSDDGEILHTTLFDDPSDLFSDVFENDEIEGGVMSIGKTKFYLSVPESMESDNVEVIREGVEINKEEVYDVGAKSCRLR
jgi:hypothetical protein